MVEKNSIRRGRETDKHIERKIEYFKLEEDKLYLGKKPSIEGIKRGVISLIPSGLEIGAGYVAGYIVGKMIN